MLYMATKFINTYKSCNKLKDFDNKLSFRIKDLEDLIKKVKNTLEAHSDLINEKIISRIEIIKTANIIANFNKEASYCSICLYKIDLEPSTNIFMHDIHISCVNLWLNSISVHSPFASTN